ncbi:MAG: methylated-DNA--[protein]-cysteine S-methyltransferase [Candidatus Thorarchaeota archaeon]
MLSEKTLSILKKDGSYLAGVFTPLGLYTSSLPRKTKKEAISEINGKGLRIVNDETSLESLVAVFDVHEGKQDAAIKDVKLDFSGFTEKQIAVLKVVMQIPYGSTMAYGEVARKAGFPGAARFVGNVMRINRLGPIIPCHRVVSATGLGGYTGGIDKKIDLLSREGVFTESFSRNPYIDI